MILVTGATGNLGSSVVEQLLKLSSADHFIVSSSTEKGVAQLKEKGLNARLANFSIKDTLIEAFRGVEKLLLISTMDQNRFEQHKNVIDAAKQVGVKHIVYTGLAIKDIESSGVKDLMISHFQTEEYLKESGLTYTILRNTMYADAMLQIVGEKIDQDINLPGGEGKVPYVLRREMGEGTANLLLQEGHDNKLYEIVGSHSYGYGDIAKVLSRIVGRDIQYQNIGEVDFVRNLTQIGLPEFVIYLHAGTLQDIKRQQYEIESSILEDLLGRPTASMESMIKELYNL